MYLELCNQEVFMTSIYVIIQQLRIYIFKSACSGIYHYYLIYEISKYVTIYKNEW